LDYDLSGSRTRNSDDGIGAVQVPTQHRPICPIVLNTGLAGEGWMMARALREHGAGLK
jgi:hypothetical protein